MTALALLCPGQGGQHGAMFERVAGHPAAEAILQATTALLGFDPRTQGPGNYPDTYYENRIAQPLVCSAILATWAVLGPTLPRPRVIAGYSVGELAAYGCAGALDATQTLTLAQQRAAAMDAVTTVPAGLTAVMGLDRHQVESLCRENSTYIAIINGPDHFILGATLTPLAAVEAAALVRGAARVVRLRVDVAAHTPLLREASRRFETQLAASALRDPTIPVLAGINAAAVNTREAALPALAAQLSTTIDWHACLEAAYEMGARVFLELGPGKGLTRMLLDLYPDAAARSVDEFRSLEGASDWVRQQLA